MTVPCVFSGGSESDMQQNAYCKYSSADLWSALGAFKPKVVPAKRNLAAWGRRIDSRNYNAGSMSKADGLMGAVLSRFRLNDLKLDNGHFQA